MLISRIYWSLALSGLLCACGGGSDSDPDPVPGSDDQRVSFVDDFAQDNVTANRLVANDQRESRNSYSISDGHLRLSTTKTSSVARQSAALETQPDSNTVRARLMLSSESSYEGDAQVLASVTGVFYNDIQDGGIDGSQGDVFVWSGIRRTSDGVLSAEYCLVRSDNTDYSEFSVFFNEGASSCQQFEFDPVLDTFYDVAITLEAGVFTFDFDGVVQNYTPPGEVYSPAEQGKGVRAWVVSDSGPGTGTAVAIFDELTVDAFSENFSSDVLPYYTTAVPVGSNVVVNDGELQMTTTSDGQSGTVRNQVELMRDPNDNVSTQFRYSSDSVLSGNPEDEARVRLITSLYNDGSIANPVNRGDGDVISYIDMRFQVDGSSSARYCRGLWDTRNGVQDWQDISCQAFALQPLADTSYEAAISLDRDNRRVVYRLGD